MKRAGDHAVDGLHAAERGLLVRADPAGLAASTLLAGEVPVHLDQVTMIAPGRNPNLAVGLRAFPAAQRRLTERDSRFVYPVSRLVSVKRMHHRPSAIRRLQRKKPGVDVVVLALEIEKLDVVVKAPE